MFARILEFIPKTDKKDEFVKVVRNEVLPLLKKQPGFLEILPLFPEDKAEKMIAITLWAEKRSAENYVKDVYPRVEQILKPYVTTTVASRYFTVETTLCGHFVESLTV